MKKSKTAFFIARKLIKNVDNRRISKPVVRVTVVGIILSIAVMIIALSVVTGFQKEVRQKVIGFGAHMQITEFTDNRSFESSPMPKNQDFYPGITNTEGVEHVQIYAYKPAILQSNKDTISYSFEHQSGQMKDTARATRDIKGVVTKGVGADFSWSFFDQYMVAGEHLQLKADKVKNEIMLSKQIAEKLRFEIGDKVLAYYIQNSGPVAKKFTLTGIYETGLEDFDNDLVFIDIRHIQKINNWGVNAGLTIADTCYNRRLIASANANGGNEYYRYNWDDGMGWTQRKNRLFCPQNDTTIRVLISDFQRKTYASEAKPKSIPDTAWVDIVFEGDVPEHPICYCPTGEQPTDVQYTDSSKTLFMDGFKLTVTLHNSGGSSQAYVGGFEVLVDNWEDLKNLSSNVRGQIDPTLEAKTIDDIHPEIFNWLNFLDTNVYIILILVLFVAIINMCSAILVMILERTNFIGLMKAMGSRNSLIRNVFIILSGHILLRGLFWGNCSALLLLFIQKLFGLITLNPEVYYVSVAPVNINISYILLLNVLTIIVCLIVLMVPALFIARIKPIRAIKFN